MTEADWLAAPDPAPLLAFVELRLTAAQRRLLAAGFCRLVWDQLTDDRLQHLVELIEGCGEGRTPAAEVAAFAGSLPGPGYRTSPPPPALPIEPWTPGTPDPIQYRVFHIGPGAAPPLRGGLGVVNFRELPWWCRSGYHAVLAAAQPHLSSVASYVAAVAVDFAREQTAEGHPHRRQIESLRETVRAGERRIDDLRFRGVGEALTAVAAEVSRLREQTAREVQQLEAEIAADAEASGAEAGRDARAGLARLVRCVAGHPFGGPVVFDPRWKTPTATGLTQAVWDGREYSTLPVLADALEEAGCDDPRPLAHLRADGPHCQGCWAMGWVMSEG